MLGRHRVLVVEDEPAIAEHLTDILTEAEGVVVGPAASLRQAQDLLRNGAAIDAALLDLKLPDGAVTPLLEALSARGVPTVIYTGGDLPSDVRDRHPGLVVLAKPAAPARLIAELRRATRQLS
jgi:DNA-binding NtrC family response regulator